MIITSYNKKLYLDGKGDLDVELLNIQVPDFFYKYYSLSKYSVESLEENTIHFSHPHTLNDIMDGNLQLWDMSDFLKEYKKDTNRYDITDVELTKCLYKDLSKKFYRHRGALCLTDNFNNDLFWPHYTSEQGFCLEFKSDEFVDSFSNDDLLVVPISYQKLTPINFNDHIEKQIVAGPTGPEVKVTANLPLGYVLSFKDKIWEYENEWRLILRSRDSLGVVSRPLDIIDDVQYKKECDDKKLRNKKYNQNSLSKIILSTLFFNNNRFNEEILDDNKDISYHFKQNGNYCNLYQFLDILYNSYNDKIFQLDKIYDENEDQIVRKMLYKINIVDLTYKYIKIKREKI